MYIDVMVFPNRIALSGPGSSDIQYYPLYTPMYVKVTFLS